MSADFGIQWIDVFRKDYTPFKQSAESALFSIPGEVLYLPTFNLEGETGERKRAKRRTGTSVEEKFKTIYYALPLVSLVRLLGHQRCSF